MAAEHAPPPGGGAGPEPAPDAGDAESALEATLAAGALQPTGRSAARPDVPRDGAAATGRGRRLLPSGPVLEHAPLLLGLDAAGREHPQGGDHEDDEDLVGRVWGCVCGWRGTVRDVSTRPFHPRVGDGGGLRRQRLARSDRDTRAELEAHFASSTPAPADLPAILSPGPQASPAARPTEADAPPSLGGRPRGRRRRLTVPRDTPLAVPPVTAPPGAYEQQSRSRHDAPSEDRASDEATIDLQGPADSEVLWTSERIRATHGSPTLLEPAASDHEAEVGEPSSVDLLEHAAARANGARDELAAAENALDAAVAAARAGGLSWRTIGRTTGIGHREAAARWGDSEKGPVL